MPYQLDVIANNTVIYVQAISPITMEEIKRYCAEAVAFINAGDNSCYLVVNAERINTTPGNVMELRDAVTPLAKHPRFLGNVTINTKDKVALNFFLNMLNSIFKVSTKLFTSEAEAVAFIISQSPQLDGILQADLNSLHEKKTPELHS